MSSQLKIVIVGGGSKAWTPNICKDMFLTPTLAGSHYVLYDIDKSAAELTAAYLTKAAAQLGVKAKITATDKQTQALKGADYVVVAISTGGLMAMAHDIAIPEDYGIYHTVGDTSGPGGWARCIRNFDVFVKLGQAFNKHCPHAVVLNYTNPMTTLTDILSRVFDGPVIGLCHGLFENLGFLQQIYQLESEDQIAARYGGLNHFFWITQARAGETDIIADLQKRLRNQSLTELQKKTITDEMGFSSNHELADELFRVTGCMPYIGDRHTCEFFPQWITSKKRMKQYKLVRTPIAERAARYKQLDGELKAQIKAKRIDDARLKRSRETAADIIDAHAHGRVFIDVGNLPNLGQIASLPMGMVVETAVRIDANGFTPLALGLLPDVVQGFIDPYVNVFTMTVDACFAGDVELALQALRIDPVCSHLDRREVRELGQRLLKAHDAFIRCFK